ncbi:hypothetical protein DQ04_02171030 [Trypanosoma grayi]|uniref:hypothetical protein n=1 Tax=Trypanosoma grayi TaxID=71804 RepID=UPI0004F4426B|nr:hypothetical protein DQ04_02171030 [Trypanosoma grayi]KEG11896.1 hypothetical protein DQ04_02171030 [Trypanosoma grayi]
MLMMTAVRATAPPLDGPLPVSPADVDDFSFLEEHQRLTELRFAEDFPDLLGPETYDGLASTHHRHKEPTRLSPQLQRDAIHKGAAHLHLFVVTNGAAAMASDSVGSASLSVPTAWYVQLVAQYEEASGMLNCALGGTPKLRLTPCPHAASKFVLFADDARAKVSAGLVLHSVDFPSVMIDGTASTSLERMTLTPVALTTALPPPPCVRCSSTGTGFEKGKREKGSVLSPNTVVSSYRDRKPSMAEFFLEEKPQTDMQTYWRMRPVPLHVDNNDAEWHTAASLDSHTLGAVPSTLPLTPVLFPLYVLR